MKLIGPSSAFAPMPTGHPLGLPGQMSVKDTQTRVLEPSRSSATNLATHLGMPMRKPAAGPEDATDPAAREEPSGRDPFSSAMRGPAAEPAAAPPTILQLKINELLRAQAEAERVAPAPRETVPATTAAVAPEADPDAARIAPPADDMATKGTASPGRDGAVNDTTPAAHAAARDDPPPADTPPSSDPSPQSPSRPEVEVAARIA